MAPNYKADGFKRAACRRRRRPMGGWGRWGQAPPAWGRRRFPGLHLFLQKKKSTRDQSSWMKEKQIIKYQAVFFDAIKQRSCIVLPPTKKTREKINMQQEWKKQRIAWELTVTGSRCWGGGQGVSRGGERGDDGHHKDCRGSGDRRHFLQVVLSSRERGQRHRSKRQAPLGAPPSRSGGSGREGESAAAFGVWFRPAMHRRERERPGKIYTALFRGGIDGTERNTCRDEQGADGLVARTRRTLEDDLVS